MSEAVEMALSLLISADGHIRTARAWVWIVDYLIRVDEEYGKALWEKYSNFCRQSNLAPPEEKRFRKYITKLYKNDILQYRKQGSRKYWKLSAK